MRIKDMPDNNRPRERFLKHGPETLSDAELFAIILRTGTIQENVIDMSNRLIAEYGLDKLFECSLKELQKIKGIGPSKAMQILSMAELGKRYNQLKNSNNSKKISCAEDVFNYFHEKLKDEKQENFIILLLNHMNNIIGEELIAKGNLNSAITNPRDIFKPVIKNSSSRIILVHNHPSGNVRPSKEDIKLTERLVEAGKLLGIDVLDHIIISGEKFWNWKS
ncbi:DNA repair protein RadC [Candidatus Pacearchaeota archaeon]|nr:DNA repair protein RadC [Candidatus Pacearchaeota archaeon]